MYAAVQKGQIVVYKCGRYDSHNIEAVVMTAGLVPLTMPCVSCLSDDRYEYLLYRSKEPGPVHSVPYKFVRLTVLQSQSREWQLSGGLILCRFEDQFSGEPPHPKEGLLLINGYPSNEFLREISDMYGVEVKGVTDHIVNYRESLCYVFKNFLWASVPVLLLLVSLFRTAGAVPMSPWPPESVSDQPVLGQWYGDGTLVDGQYDGTYIAQQWDEWRIDGVNGVYVSLDIDSVYPTATDAYLTLLFNDAPDMTLHTLRTGPWLGIYVPFAEPDEVRFLLTRETVVPEPTGWVLVATCVILIFLFRTVLICKRKLSSILEKASFGFKCRSRRYFGPR